MSGIAPEVQAEFETLMEEHISEEYYKTMSAVGENPDHKEDVANLNGLFDKQLEAYHAARREMYLFINRAQDNFYTKGFWAGVKFFNELNEHLKESENNDKAAQLSGSFFVFLDKMLKIQYT